jgi:hypothetical protein
VFRRLFTNLNIVAQAEQIPLEYLIESLLLFGFSRKETFARATPEMIDDISRRLGVEVVSAAKEQYREDMLAGETDPKQPARRAAPRATETASAGATSPVGDRVGTATSVGRPARSRGGRPARSASPPALARKGRPNHGR